MEFKTAFTASESRTIAVPFIGMPTVGTLLRSIPGIYEEDMFSKSLSLVSDKLFKLVERPAVEFAIEFTTSTLLDSDFAQIFKSKYSIFRVHNFLRYAVIDISRKQSLATRKTLKLSFGRRSAFGLQL